MSNDQHIVGLSFKSLSPGMVEGVRFLSDRLSGLELSPQDLNLKLRMDLFRNPNPGNAMAYLFRDKGQGDEFSAQAGVMFGADLYGVLAQPHPVDANILGSHQDGPVIAFAAAGRKRGNASSFVIDVQFESAATQPVVEDLTDRLIASHGGRKFRNSDIVADGLYVERVTARRAHTVNVLDDYGGRLAPRQAFYEICDAENARDMVMEIHRLKLGHSRRQPRW